MVKLNRFEKLIDIIPTRRVVCPSCKFTFPMGRGKQHHAKRKWGGPYCPKCGKGVRHGKYNNHRKGD